MIIYVINGNTNADVSAEIERAAIEVAFTSTEIRMITPEMGPATVEGYLDGQISAIGVCNEIAKYYQEADAFVIACFSDPGLYAARELTQKPILGIAEASMVTAVQLGHQFSMLTSLHRLRPVLKGLVTKYGFISKLASIETIELSVAEVASAKTDYEEAFYTAGITAINKENAEVLILAGAVMTGMEKSLSENLGVPVLDPVKCAVAQAQALNGLGLVTSHIGGFSKPSKKNCQNCPDEIKRFYD